MKNLSLEERILHRYIPPSLFETKMISGKTDVQYSEEGREIISYFKKCLKEKECQKEQLVRFSTRSEDSFLKFFEHLQKSWEVYLDLSSKMNSYSENLKFLYPEKVRLFSDLVQTTFNLNTHLYLITDIEKEIYEKNLEKLPEDRMLAIIESVNSFPVYLSNEIGETDDSTKNPYQIRELLSKRSGLRKLFQLTGSSNDLFGKLIQNNRETKKKIETGQFIPRGKFEESLKDILAYDHFFELFLRKSGILMNDLKFYIDLSQRLSCKKSISVLLEKLSELNVILGERFQPKIPQYTQTQLSCGATCLANVVGTYYPYINVDKSLEDGIHRLVTVKGFFNNLPSSLAYVSREKFGIPSHFFADLKTFVPLFLEQKADHEPLKKFQEDYERVKNSSLDYGNITILEIKEKLEKGHLISFVTGQSPMLHYKLITGYNFREAEGFFHVFDPAQGTTKIRESEILTQMKNDKSSWGVEYVPPESVIFDETRKSLTKAKELLS